MTSDAVCFHCGEAVPQHAAWSVRYQDEDHAVCCAGCQAVFNLINQAGLNGYYRFRDGPAQKPDTDELARQQAWQRLDERVALWGERRNTDEYELILQVEGIRCAACAWLIRSHLESARGIRSVQVDTSSGFTRITWNPAQIRLSRLAGLLLELGYFPHLPLSGGGQQARARERQESLKRLGIAGLGMMQVMMYAIGLYSGAAQGISPAAKGFLTWVSMLVTLPVLWFSGRIFFQHAWWSLRAGRPGMDVSVALAIGLAFVASCINFFRGQGEVWFDSVVMFIFFLTLGRHVEMILRHRNLAAGAALARLLPEWAQRLRRDEGGKEAVESVPAEDLRAGDRVRVLSGETFPADGVISQGATRVDEALLTGESQALSRGIGEAVIGGSLNLAQPVDITVTASGPDSTVSALGRLLMRAQLQRQETLGMPHWLVPVFVVCVLAIALAAAAYWMQHDPARAFPVLLAVLVASCPCALSLALPAVHAAASRSLLDQGILLTGGDSLHALSRVDTIVFDKTGTLTRGQPGIAAVQVNPDHPDAGAIAMAAAGACASDGNTREPLVQAAMDMAAALERYSGHAVAQAFRQSSGQFSASAHQPVAGQGIEAEINGESWRIGQPGYVLTGDIDAHAACRPAGGCGDIWLGNRRGWLARFVLNDTLREDAGMTIRQLQAQGCAVHILSGDSAEAVSGVAASLDVALWQARQTADMKLQATERMKAGGHTVMMVGDGVNDAPVLAAADVSLAVAGGTELANSVADLILTRNSLAGVLQAQQTARRVRRLVRQNLGWAIGYNAAVMPLAVSGVLQPWMAAIGMSLSSLLVVANAARLLRKPGTRPQPPVPRQSRSPAVREAVIS